MVAATKDDEPERIVSITYDRDGNPLDRDGNPITQTVVNDKNQPTKVNWAEIAHLKTLGWVVEAGTDGVFQFWAPGRKMFTRGFTTALDAWEEIIHIRGKGNGRKRS